MSKLKNCPTCSKEIAKSVKVCTHCGEKMKSGLIFRLFKLFITVVVIILIVIGFLSSEDKENQSIESLVSSKPTLSFPSKRLDDLFFHGAERLTSMQLEEEVSKIKSGVIQGEISVYNVIEESEKVFRIMAFDMNQVFYTTVVVHVQSPDDAKHIKSLKKRDKVSFRGRIESVSLFRGNMGEGKLVINPAVIIK